MHSWQLQHAKNRLSELVTRAIDEGPQVLTRRGVETAVVLSIDEYRRLTRPAVDLVEFFASSPLAGTELDLSRSRDTGREVEL